MKKSIIFGGVFAVCVGLSLNSFGQDTHTQEADKEVRAITATGPEFQKLESNRTDREEEKPRIVFTGPELQFIKAEGTSETSGSSERMVATGPALTTIKRGTSTTTEGQKK